MSSLCPTQFESWREMRLPLGLVSSVACHKHGIWSAVLQVEGEVRRARGAGYEVLTAKSST